MEVGWVLEWVLSRCRCQSRGRRGGGVQRDNELQLISGRIFRAELVPVRTGAIHCQREDRAFCRSYCRCEIDFHRCVDARAGGEASNDGAFRWGVVADQTGFRPGVVGYRFDVLRTPRAIRYPHAQLCRDYRLRREMRQIELHVGVLDGGGVGP